MNDPEKLGLSSLDVAQKKRAELKACLGQTFPEIFAEGAIDFDQLRRVLGDWVDGGKERFGLNWPGKAECMKIVQQPSVGTLRPVRNDSVNFDGSENLLIEGDNLEVLKLLQKAYFGKVKMIYIDPPYNTGNDLIYPDNYTESLQTYLEYTGQTDAEGRRFATNTETEGRFHSRWLNMMYPRLYLARNLLRADGVIFISIDDNESDNLRKLCDEVFGEENFVACLIWQKMDSPSRNEKDRPTTNYHDYILLYARDARQMRLRRMGKPAILDAYPLTLADGRLARRRQLRKNGKNARRQDRPTLWFPLSAPDGVEVWPIAPEGWEGRWVLSPETWKEREAAGMTEWIKRDYGWVPYYIETAPEEPTVPWPTLWTDVDQNRQAKARFTELLGAEIEFDNPKPPNLISQMLRMATEEGDLVLDFFAGSGVTGEAVLKQSGGQRRFLLVQLPEPTGRTDLPTIADIAKKRLRSVIEEIQAKQTSELELDDASDADPGFRVFRLAESNFKRWDYNLPADDQMLGKQLELHVNHVREGRTADDLLYEILLKSGFQLSTHVKELTLAGKSVLGIADGALLICLEKEITPELIDALADATPLQVICLDEAFKGNDQLKANAVQTFKAREQAEESEIVFRTV